MKLPLLAILALVAAAVFAAENPAGTNSPSARASNSATNSPEAGKQQFLASLKWTKGPAKGALGTLAEIQVPAGFMLTGKDGTQKLMRAMGNPAGDSELGLLAPTNLEWFVVFEFSNVGYVKDDDKDKLNPDAILKSIKDGTEASNKQREKMGSRPIHVVGWDKSPTYNPESHNLEWAIRAESGGDQILNYNTRLLGRKGVMEANLVVEPSKLAETLPIYSDLLKTYSYTEGERYAEYRQGDKLAKYGLAALITGGAAAVAIKTGLFASLILMFKKAGKLLILGVIAIGVWIKKLFTGRQKSDYHQQ